MCSDLAHDGRKFGETLESHRLRIYLTDRVCLERGRMPVDGRRLPARQGWLVLAYLVSERWLPVTRNETNLAIQYAGRLPDWTRSGRPATCG